MATEEVPYMVLAPSIAQVRHIGVDGMHLADKEKQKGNHPMRDRIRDAAAHWTIPKPFHGTGVIHEGWEYPKSSRANGGFHHPKDIEHCKSILTPKWQLIA